MQVLFLVLNKTECLEGILEALMRNGIGGATVLESEGMMRAMHPNLEDLPMFGTLRQLINPARSMSKTIIMVVEDKQVDLIRKLIKQETGGLNHPDTGILFAVPTVFVEGIGDKR